MIKCYFVDVKSISSDLPRSGFVESELERLADLILATDGLLRPLILQESGVEKYTVIEGHREYYAAVRAKEKDLGKAEMVNAFVINPHTQQSAIAQLGLFAENKPANITTPTTISLSPEQLSSLISATISQQLQPIVAQLTEQKKVLDGLNVDRQLVMSQGREIADPKRSEPQAEDRQSPTTRKIKSSQTTKTCKSDRSSKTADFLRSIDPIKVINTLDLINALNQDMLLLRMKQSGITNAVKLATNIITNRNNQPEQKFDTWETLIATKVPGLGDATIQKIIEKLK